MNILVCIKRIPATGGRITLTADAQEIDTRHLAFVMSPHEECAVEAALQLVEKQGGSTTVLTLGPPVAADQLRDALALGVSQAVLLETDGREWDARATAGAIVQALRTLAAEGLTFDLVLFGNEAADTGDYQVGIRVAQALDWPCVTGIKALEIQGGTATAMRDTGSGWEIYEVDLPAAFTVKEGINLPRYPSLKGRLRAKKQTIREMKPEWPGNGLEKVRLKLPKEQGKRVQILGEGPEAAARAVEIFKELGIL